ncbi:MAG TPA: hypothetical protein VE988_21975 [Gemmataceae bacterium]|nr:hypothetical protein [Gemmataceae bacterium]
MRQSILIVALMPVLAIATPTGTVSASPLPQSSAYMGSYSGYYTTSIGGGGTQKGAVAVTVGSNGVVAGVCVNNTVGLKGTITGTINSRGEFFGTLTWNDGSVWDLRGTLRKTANGRLQGTVNQYARNGLFASGHLDLPSI